MKPRIPRKLKKRINRHKKSIFRNMLFYTLNNRLMDIILRKGYVTNIDKTRAYSYARKKTKEDINFIRGLDKGKNIYERIVI